MIDPRAAVHIAATQSPHYAAYSIVRELESASRAHAHGLIALEPIRDILEAILESREYGLAEDLTAIKEELGDAEKQAEQDEKRIEKLEAEVAALEDRVAVLVSKNEKLDDQKQALAEREATIAELRAKIAASEASSPQPWERWYLDLREAIGGPAFPEPHARAVRHAREMAESDAIRAQLTAAQETIANLSAELDSRQAIIVEVSCELWDANEKIRAATERLPRRRAPLPAVLEHATLATIRRYEERGELPPVAPALELCDSVPISLDTPTTSAHATHDPDAGTYELAPSPPGTFPEAPIWTERARAELARLTAAAAPPVPADPDLACHVVAPRVYPFTPTQHAALVDLAAHGAGARKLTRAMHERLTAHGYIIAPFGFSQLTAAGRAALAGWKK